MFTEKLQAGFPFLGDIIALCVMDVHSKRPLLITARAKNPQEVRDAFWSSWTGIFGPPFCIQMDEGGE